MSPVTYRQAGLAYRDSHTLHRGVLGNVKVTISATLVTAYDLATEDGIEERSTASFHVLDEQGDDHYDEGQPVVITDQADNLLWAGVVAPQTGETRVGPRSAAIVHTIACIDWRYLADKRIVAKAYQNMTAGAIVNDLIANYLAAEGVTGDVAAGATVTEAIFNYVSVTRCLEVLAERSGFWWNIDKDKVLRFLPRSQNIATEMITEATVVLAMPAVERGNPQYRNRQYIKGGKDTTDTQIETQKGDGAKRAFALRFPVAEAPAVKVNGASKTVGIKGLETGKDFYWAKGDQIVSQDDAGTVLGTADTLQVTYKGIFDVVVLSVDEAEIVARKAKEAAGSGYVEVVDDVPEVTGRAVGFEIAAKKLSQFAVAGRRFKVRLKATNLLSGELVTVDLPSHGIGSEQFLVERVAATYDVTPLYDVTLVQGPISGSWSKFFERLAVRGEAFVVRENIAQIANLSVLQQFAESVAWDQAVAQTVFACPVPADTLFPSGVLLPC